MRRQPESLREALRSGGRLAHRRRSQRLMSAEALSAWHHGRRTPRVRPAEAAVWLHEEFGVDTVHWG